MPAKVVSIDFDEASLRRFYRRIDPDGLIKDPIGSFLGRVADTIAKKARHNAPVDTGKMRDSIRTDAFSPRREAGGVARPLRGRVEGGKACKAENDT